MRLHILERIAAITKDTFNLWYNHTFIELRDCCCHRSEPARLLLSEWKDAVNGSWLDQQRMLYVYRSMLTYVEDPIEYALINSLRITYQSGKGNVRLVPILMPEDSVQALMLLAYPEQKCGRSLFRKSISVSSTQK